MNWRGSWRLNAERTCWERSYATANDDVRIRRVDMRGRRLCYVTRKANGEAMGDHFAVAGRDVCRQHGGGYAHGGPVNRGILLDYVLHGSSTVDLVAEMQKLRAEPGDYLDNLLDQYRRWNLHLARVTKLCLDAGIESRRVRLAEDAGRVLADMFRELDDPPPASP